MNKDEFEYVVNQIQESVNLFQYFERPLYVDLNQSILIRVQERDKYVVIDLNFGDKYQIVGMTDQKTGGLESFMDYFDMYGQCRIHLECTETKEIFIIDGIENVNIELLEC